MIKLKVCSFWRSSQLRQSQLISSKYNKVQTTSDFFTPRPCAYAEYWAWICFLLLYICLGIARSRKFNHLRPERRKYNQDEAGIKPRSSCFAIDPSIHYTMAPGTIRRRWAKRKHQPWQTEACWVDSGRLGTGSPCCSGASGSSSPLRRSVQWQPK